jgi:hypothetical protein
MLPIIGNIHSHAIKSLGIKTSIKNNFVSCNFTRTLYLQGFQQYDQWTLASDLQEKTRRYNWPIPRSHFIRVLSFVVSSWLHGHKLIHTCTATAPKCIVIEFLNTWGIYRVYGPPGTHQHESTSYFQRQHLFPRINADWSMLCNGNYQRQDHS